MAFGRGWPVGTPPSSDITTQAYKGWLHAQAWLYTKAEYEQYDPALEYWPPAGGNTGILLRDTSRAEAGLKSPPDYTKTPSKAAYEIQLNRGYPGDPKRPAVGPMGLPLHDRVSVAMLRNVRLRAVK